MNTLATRFSLLALAMAALTGISGLAAAQNSPLSETAPTQENEPVRATPRYLLLGSHGRAVRAEDFRERYQLISFGFTGCPDVCPTTMLEMQQVLAALGEQAKKLQPIFITIDPERDTTAVLDTYTHNFDARILGLTGKPELVRWAANNFKVQFEKVQEAGAAPNVYTMDHSAGMFLLGPDGQLLNKFVYGTPAKDIVARIEGWMAADHK
jgi:protein SCO1/2